jgi:hypothetical protein
LIHLQMENRKTVMKTSRVNPLRVYIHMKSRPVSLVNLWRKTQKFIRQAQIKYPTSGNHPRTSRKVAWTHQSIKIFTKYSRIHILNLFVPLPVTNSGVSRHNSYPHKKHHRLICCSTQVYPTIKIE